MCIFTELLDVLQNEQTPFGNRLQIASRVFTVSELNSVKNKEIVLQWLQNSLSSFNENHDEIYSALKNCIVAATDVWLHPHLSDAIILVRLFCFYIKFILLFITFVLIVYIRL